MFLFSLAQPHVLIRIDSITVIGVLVLILLGMHEIRIMGDVVYMYDFILLVAGILILILIIGHMLSVDEFTCPGMRTGGIWQRHRIQICIRMCTLELHMVSFGCIEDELRDACSTKMQNIYVCSRKRRLVNCSKTPGFPGHPHCTGDPQSTQNTINVNVG